MNAQRIHDAKIQAARRSLEENDGQTIRKDKIREWALLEISELLREIHRQLLTNSSLFRQPQG
jgi:hypothetical protein